MPDDNTISPADFDRNSQIAHVATTACVVFVCGVFFGVVGILGSGSGCTCYALWHEFWYDPRDENVATRGSDAKDFFFLMTGVTIGITLWELARHLKLIR